MRKIIAAALVAAAVAVAVILVLRAREVTAIQASGVVEATQSDVASKVLGRLVALRVQDGDRVKKGQVLAVLERIEPGLNVQQARAAVAAADAQVRAARAAYALQVQT